MSGAKLSCTYMYMYRISLNRSSAVNFFKRIPARRLQYLRQAFIHHSPIIFVFFYLKFSSCQLHSAQARAPSLNVTMLCTCVQENWKCFKFFKTCINVCMCSVVRPDFDGENIEETPCVYLRQAFIQMRLLFKDIRYMYYMYMYVLLTSIVKCVNEKLTANCMYKTCPFCHFHVHIICVSDFFLPNLVLNALACVSLAHVHTMYVHV